MLAPLSHQSLKTPPPAIAGRRRQTWTAYECCRVRSDARDVRGVKALGARLNLELDFLTFGESLKSIHAYRRKVNEHILAAFLFNEAVALRIIEPLYFPSGHASCLLRGEPSPCRIATGQTDPGLRPPI